MASRTFIIQPGEGIAFRFCGQFLGFPLLGVNIQYNPTALIGFLFRSNCVVARTRHQTHNDRLNLLS